MASNKPERSNAVSTIGATDRLSPCLRLLIEILLSEVTTHSSVVSALNETDLGTDEGMPQTRHQSRDLSIKENAMSQSNGKAPRSEKGLLTPDNCVVALIDHQPQMLFGTSNFDRQGIINNTVALSKTARVFDVPVVLTTVETKAFSGNLWPQLRAVFPNREPIERSSMNSWDDKNFVATIERTNRKKIVLAGLWTETCVALPTVQAIHDGYEDLRGGRLLW